jgi:hypothetical protein
VGSSSSVSAMARSLATSPRYLRKRKPMVARPQRRAVQVVRCGAGSERVLDQREGQRAELAHRPQGPEIRPHHPEPQGQRAEIDRTEHVGHRPLGLSLLDLARADDHAEMAHRPRDTRDLDLALARERAEAVARTHTREGVRERDVSDAVGDALQVGVDLGQRPRRLEDVEVPVERDLVADLGLLVVDPGVGRVGQHLALEVGLTSSDSGTFSVSRRLLSGCGLPLPLPFCPARPCPSASRSGRSTVMVR